MSVSVQNQPFDSGQIPVRFRLGKTNGGWSIQGIDR